MFKKILFKLFSLILILNLVLNITTTASANTLGASIPLKLNAVIEISKLQKDLDLLKQKLSKNITNNQLSILNTNTLQLTSAAETLITRLLPDSTQLQVQLDVIGPTPTSFVKETSTIAYSRDNINARKKLLDNQIECAKFIIFSANKILVQIVTIHRNNILSQLILNSGSIFSANFWSPILHPKLEDKHRITSLVNNINLCWQQAWSSDFILVSSILLVLTIILWFCSSLFLDKLLFWFSINMLPERMHCSFIVCSTVLITVLNISLGAQLFYLMVTSLPNVSYEVIDFADGIKCLIFFSSLIFGLGRAFLSKNCSYSQFLTIHDAIYHKIKKIPILLAILVFISGTIEQLNSSLSTSVSTTIWGYGISSLLITSVILFICFSKIRIKSTQLNLRSIKSKIEINSAIVDIIQICIFTFSITIFISLLIGYISLARFLTYELVWIAMVLFIFYLLMHFMVDFFESVFTPNTLIGVRIKHMFNIEERHLLQISTLLTAISKILLIMFAIIALINGNFEYITPLTLIPKVIKLCGVFEKLVVPANILNALIFFAIAIYILRLIKNWLEKDFLTKTMIEPGIRYSLVTLFSNFVYVLVIFILLAILGIKWDNIAWIVSALTVGIGFGLQEIVKNFISGLILLIEQKVKVGDLISISGIEGDIRCINIRATEIKINDRSTVIVPNFQLISQNVRNITMGNAQGVVTIELTFSLDINTEKVCMLLLEVYNKHKEIQVTPTPSVTFSQLNSAGIVLSITGFVRSSRIVASTKSELLVEILKNLRSNGIKL
ncbi:Putative mechanosensitive (Mcs) ion channel protein [secondary endosymbiont of Trabutina mannipara]|uniref:Putative mechanosensitive (Mcs) ion channel protein n=1 Tax=secondary endosymbiont of Trabutina mannipara TaxID=1835721 RepID=A0A1C3L3R9_9ENTR|nr:DUF3772 domain-containing protein [secondary endosymbiont of Trabutina mannipara]SBT81916.1 Putative mechanosensitive (Mcs) ion channel protein [secondary endosymbiont of Trabutina mannipara]